MGRWATGRLNGIHAEPGTLLGPNDSGEFMVVIEKDDTGCKVGYASQDDMIAAGDVTTGPRSIAEYRLWSERQRRIAMMTEELRQRAVTRK